MSIRRSDSPLRSGSIRVNLVFSDKDIFRFGWIVWLRIRRLQLREPVEFSAPGRVRSYWWFRDKWYSTTEDYSPMEICLLLQQQEHRREGDLFRAKSVLEHWFHPSIRRGISEDTRRFVWQRDEGRCQKCGSSELIQFDHVVPVSMGGSNSAQNLQLLCMDCNRQKGVSIC